MSEYTDKQNDIFHEIENVWQEFAKLDKRLALIEEWRDNVEERGTIHSSDQIDKLNKNINILDNKFAVLTNKFWILTGALTASGFLLGIVVTLLALFKK